ncbi:hypothetical protein N7447_001510 [Penicillium robsamsonii]|uniref:uncharacterized protein n=1 Tax=Penicillium robsamsonii TaxID=1792511 RepID=UPI002549B23A|nr:uncharacterized protein N7447_001510 [Penicillium robsamsonii]KAJ5835484.1 hypothetical protein N7447_001510 [Penicillium robsamsonii]
MASLSSSNTSEKPSEASLPLGIFSPPRNSYEWKRALANVKWLCFNHQYKQCVLRCNQLIDTASNPLHPIRATYLHYYAATSYEYMGRAAHIFSAVKVPLLTSAMEQFQTAYESLPAAIPLPVLNPNQTYSPVTFLHSPNSSPRSSVTTVVWSPPLLDRDVAPGPGPGPNSEALSVENLSAHNAGLARTPPSPVPFPSSSSNSTITTAFCVTPPPAAREVSRLDYDAPPPAFHIPPPTRKPPPPPSDVSPRPATRDQLISFNSDRDGLPSGGSIVRSIALMIDSSIMAGGDDPFVTRTPPKPRIPNQPPMRLSPIKFPAGLEDPVKRSALIPPPLAIRKSSGEVHMCNSSTMVTCRDPEQETSKSEVNRPVRARPPRLPLKINPTGHLNANTEKTNFLTLAPQPKCLGPVLPSPMTTPPPTPTPILRKKVPFLGSPFTSRAGSPEQKSTKWLSSRSTKPSPAPVSAARVAQINEFNSAVKWLREHIPADVTGLRKQIKHVADLQQARRSRNTTMARSASFWTFSPVKSNPGEPQEPPVIEGPNIDGYGNVIRIETKVQRIKRLREENWRIGIRSKHSLWKGTEYYDQLCQTALAELGETGYGSREWFKR